MSIGWAVAMTQPNAEGKVVLNLERQGYETFLPKFREVVEVDGRRCSRSGVLFSRYVFVHLCDVWHSIMGTIGVSSLIKNGERPAVVERSVVDELKARTGADGFIDLSKPIVVRKAGDAVSVVGGPFYGFKGIYQGMTAHEREIVLLDMLGRKVRVELESELVA